MEAVKRKAGRPKGSLNKVKTVERVASPVVPVETPAVAVEPPVETPISPVTPL